LGSSRSLFRSEQAGFALSLEIAGSALVLGMAIYLWMAKAFPKR